MLALLAALPACGDAGRRPVAGEGAVASGDAGSPESVVGRPPAVARRSPSRGADPARGRVLLARHQCGACHVIPGVPGGATPYGPPLTAWGSRGSLAGVLANDAPTLERWLQDPQALVPGTPMPRLGVGPRDARDIAAALLALR